MLALFALIGLFVVDASASPTTPPTAFPTLANVGGNYKYNNWTTTAATSANYYGISSSDSGQYVNAAIFYTSSHYQVYGTYYSQDYGTTWHKSNMPSGSYSALANSGDGKYVYATCTSCSGSGIYNSSTYGVTWSATSLPSNTRFTSVACNGNGSIVYAGITSSGGIYKSDDYSATWTLTTASTSLSWTALATSATGQYVVATTGNSVSGQASGSSGIYTSSNYGVSWTLTSALTSYFYEHVCSNADGSVIVAVSSQSNGVVFVSTNYGVSWSNPNPSVYGYWTGCASDSTGQYLIASNDGKGLYLSSNYGTTWSRSMSASSTAIWYGVASSSNAQYLYAVTTTTTGYGHVYAATANTTVVGTLPTMQPTTHVGAQPSALPSVTPLSPTHGPTLHPSVVPVLLPTVMPAASQRPSVTVTDRPIAPTLLPTESNWISLYASQVIYGISYDTYVSNGYYAYTVESAVAACMNGVTTEDFDYIACESYSGRRRLLEGSLEVIEATDDSQAIWVSYMVYVNNPNTNYTSLSNQLTKSVADGTFNVQLNYYSTVYDTTGLYDCVSYSVDTSSSGAPGFDDDTGSNSSSGLSGGAIAGIVIALLFVMGAIGGVVYYYKCRKTTTTTTTTTTASGEATTEMKSTANPMVTEQAQFGPRMLRSKHITALLSKSLLG